MRVCLDTNVLVAAFATRGLCADVVRHVVAQHGLVLPSTVVDELRRVLTRKLEVSPEALEAVQAFLGQFEPVPRPPEPASLPVEDETDLWVLAGAAAGGAEVFVTGDRELLEHAEGFRIQNTKPRKFWEHATGGSRLGFSAAFRD